MSVDIPVSASFDSGDLNAQLAAFVQQMDKMAASIAEVNGAKINPISSAAVTDFDKVLAQAKALQSISSGLNQRVKATGQQGTAFHNWDWSKLYDDPKLRQKMMEKAYQYVTSSTSLARDFMPPPAPVAPPTAPQNHSPSPTAPGTRPSPGSSRIPTPGGAVWQVTNSGLNAAGPVGGVTSNAIRTGMTAGAEGGMGAGIMAGATAGIVGMIAMGVGKMVGAIKDQIDAVNQDSIALDTLKRSMGDTGVSFAELRAATRGAAEDIDVTFAEATKMAAAFSKISGQSLRGLGLADELRNAGGMGRSLGLDPNETNRFMAEMRAMRVTSNVDDSRRLALMIGESVGKSGGFAKAGEVLQAISGFATSQTRASLSRANVEGYAGALTGLMSSRIPGLDAQGSASLLNTVNGAIMGGGRAGEAGQAFMYRSLGAKHGLGPIETLMLQESGAFGTGKNTFGAGSVYARYMGGALPGADKMTGTNFADVISGLKDQYSDKGLRADATSRVLGVSHAGAMALHLMQPDELNGMSKRLDRLKMPMASVNAESYSALGQIETGGMDFLKAQGRSLFGMTGKDALTDANKKDLEGAFKSGDTEKIRDVLTQLTAARGQEQTEGEKDRAAIVGVQNAVTSAATTLAGPLNDMRAGILMMAGGGKMGPVGIKKEVEEATAKELAEKSDGEIERKYMTGDPKKWSTDAIYRARMTAEQVEAKKKITATSKARIGLIEQGKDPDADMATQRTDPSVPDYLRGDFAPGSAGDPKGRFNPGNLRSGPGGTFGKYGSWQDGINAADANLKSYGTNRGIHTLAGVISTWAPKSDKNDTDAYIKNMSQWTGFGANQDIDLSDPSVRKKLLAGIFRQEGSMPKDMLAALGGSGSSTEVSGSADVKVTVTIKDPMNKRMADPTTISTKVTLAQAAGTKK